MEQTQLFLSAAALLWETERCNFKKNMLVADDIYTITNKTKTQKNILTRAVVPDKEELGGKKQQCP